MNPWPTLAQWLEFSGVLSLELLLIFAVAKLISLRLRPAEGRRCLWQVTMLGMLLVFAGEISGAREMTRPKRPSPEKEKTAPPTRTVVVTIKDAEFPPATADAPVEPGSMELNDIASRIPRWHQAAVWPAAFWLGISFLLLGRVFLGQLVSLSYRLQVRRNTDVELARRTARLATLLLLRRTPLIARSQRAVTPFTFGAWKPVIVLPARFTEVFTPAQQDVAIAHELAHVVRLDSVWRGLSNITCALLWWSPFTWMARRELDHATELVADESSHLLPDGPDRLAECLVACASQMQKSSAAAWLGMDGGGLRSSLGKRVARLLHPAPGTGVAVRVPWYWRTGFPIVCTFGVWLAIDLMPGNITPRSQDPWRDSLMGNALAALADSEPVAVPKRSAIEPARQVRQKAVSVEDFGTAITTNPGTEATPLHTRLFKIDLASLSQSLSNLIAFSFREEKPGDGPRRLPTDRADVPDENSATQVSALKRFLGTAGIDFNVAGKALFYNDRHDTLMVRATLQDLDTVEKALQMLNATRPQLAIRVKVMEVPASHARDVLLSFDLTNSTRTVGTISNPSLLKPTNVTGSASTSIASRPPPTVTGILTDEQFRRLLANLERIGGTDLLSAPTVTTMSGRQAQIKVVDIHYVVTDVDYHTDGLPGGRPPEPRPITEPFEIGPVVDIVPYVESDGYTIQMTVLPTLREFLGYDEDPLNRQNDLPATGGPLAPAPRQVTPLPKFRLRQIAATVRVWDGQTLVLGAGQARIPEKVQGADGTVTTNQVDKELFFFITPSLIDAAGNRLHTDDDLRRLRGVPKPLQSAPKNEYE